MLEKGALALCTVKALFWPIGIRLDRGLQRNSYGTLVGVLAPLLASQSILAPILEESFANTVLANRQYRRRYWQTVDPGMMHRGAPNQPPQEKKTSLATSPHNPPNRHASTGRSHPLCANRPSRLACTCWRGRERPPGFARIQKMDAPYPYPAVPPLSHALRRANT